MIRYEKADDINQRMVTIANKLGMKHDLSRVVCVRSHGSSARRTLARCHALPRIMQLALGTRAVYVVEVIAEKFDKLSGEEQDKTIIHELMHIPKSFGGGFRNHSQYVTREKVERMYRKFLSNV
ncbi:MAG: putative metallopeptidase [Candidatus Aenigmatarchaeota archaeon]